MTVQVFGFNKNSLLGYSQKPNQWVNEIIESDIWSFPNVNWVEIVANKKTDSIGLTQNGDLYLNKSGSCSIQKIETFEKFSEIAAGGFHFLAVSKDRSKVYSWAYNFVGSKYGSLGHGKNIFFCEPTEIKYFTNLNVNIKQIVCGEKSSFVLLENNELYHFGFCGDHLPYFHQKNFSDETFRKKRNHPLIYYSPQKIMSNRKLIPKPNTMNYFISLNEKNDIITHFSSSQSHQKHIRYPSASIHLNFNIKKITMGYYSNFLLTDAGKVYSCGRSPYNGLKKDSQSTFQEITTLPIIIDIYSVNYYTVCIDEYGYLHCMGNKKYYPPFPKTTTEQVRSPFRIDLTKCKLSFVGEYLCCYILNYENKLHEKKVYDLYPKYQLKDPNFIELIKKPTKLLNINFKKMKINQNILIKIEDKLMALCFLSNKLGFLLLSGEILHSIKKKTKNFIQIEAPDEDMTQTDFCLNVSKAFYDESAKLLYLIYFDKHNKLCLIRYSIKKRTKADLEYNKKSLMMNNKKFTRKIDEKISNFLFKSRQNIIILTTFKGKIYYIDIAMKEVYAIPLKMYLPILPNRVSLFGEDELIYFVTFERGLFYLDEYFNLIKITAVNSEISPIFTSLDNSLLFSYQKSLHLILNQKEYWVFDFKKKQWTISPTYFRFPIYSHTLIQGQLFFTTLKNIYSKIISISDPKQSEIQQITKYTNKKFKSGNLLQYLVKIKDCENRPLMGKDLLKIKFLVKRNNQKISIEEMKSTLQIIDKQNSENVTINYKPEVCGEYNLMIKFNQTNKLPKPLSWRVYPSNHSIEKCYLKRFPNLKSGMTLKGFPIDNNFFFNLILCDKFKNPIHSRATKKNFISILEIKELPKISSIEHFLNKSQKNSEQPDSDSDSDFDSNENYDYELNLNSNSDSDSDSNSDSNSNSRYGNNTGSEIKLYRKLFYSSIIGEKTQDGEVKFSLKVKKSGFYKCEIFIKLKKLPFCPFFIECKEDYIVNINIPIQSKK
ncbi:regulator of chromosome condensation [Anaeramoeba flamelloides]|uniref:Regulator of chromosome condensation n=1 Tax=Anaeramoeba flamelloides TaxID=1746091 RepID=A0AAV8A6M7_9EUKA|nr:regulator of chromosome condensation [Anaeramoeba flamelloides]